MTTSALPAGWSLLQRIDTPTRQLAALLARIATDNEPPSHTFHQVALGTGSPLVMALVARPRCPSAAGDRDTVERSRAREIEGCRGV